MNKIIECINEYINQNKSLNLKGLGKFNLIENEAVIHPILMEFKPPAAEILFEHNINTENEINFIEFCKNKLNTAESEIESLINEFVSQVNNDLESANVAVVKSFAIFEKDMTKGVVLKLSESSNFNLQNYGLTEFKLNPESAANKGIKAIKAEPKIKSKRRFPKFVAFILLLFILIGGTYTVLHFTNNTEQYLELLNEKIALLSKNKVEKEEIKTEEKSFEEPKVETIAIEPVAEQPQPQLDEKSGMTEELKEIENISGQTKRYFVVDNIFRKEELAIKRVEKLKSEGFNSEIAGQTRQGMHIVVYNGFADKQLAEQELSKIRQNVNKDAWLYIK